MDSTVQSMTEDYEATMPLLSAVALPARPLPVCQKGITSDQAFEEQESFGEPVEWTGALSAPPEPGPRKSYNNSRSWFQTKSRSTGALNNNWVEMTDLGENQPDYWRKKNSRGIPLEWQEIPAEAASTPRRRAPKLSLTEKIIEKGFDIVIDRKEEFEKHKADLIEWRRDWQEDLRVRYMPAPAPDSPGVQLLNTLNSERHNPVIAFENEPIKFAKVKGTMKKAKIFGGFLARNIGFRRRDDANRPEEYFTTHSKSSSGSSIPTQPRLESRQSGKESARFSGTQFSDTQLSGYDASIESEEWFQGIQLYGEPIMAVATHDLKDLRGETFRIDEGRFNFTHCPGLLDQKFYVGPPPEQVEADGNLPSYFRHFEYKGQSFDVVPYALREKDPPYNPQGPHRRTGLELQGAVGNAVGGDPSIPENPGGNATTNYGFHLFNETYNEDSLQVIDPNEYLSDYYHMPYFEEKEPKKVKKLLYADFGVESDTDESHCSDESESSDGYAPSFEPNVLSERRDQTPACAMIIFLHIHGWTFDQICQKLGPLDSNFLFLNESAWYRSKRLPDVDGLSFELIDRICEHAAADPESFEMRGDYTTPANAKSYHWRTRDRNVGYFVKKVIENYLFWRLNGYFVHKGMPLGYRITQELAD